MPAQRTPRTVSWVLVLIPLAGCLGGDARVELAAADSLDALAAELRLVVDEYHADLGAADDARQSDVVSAFIARVRADSSDDVATAAHAAAFESALRHLRVDREVAFERRTAAQENLNIVHDTADGLRRVGVASLSLEDEAKRYLLDFIATRQAASRGMAKRSAAMQSASPVRAVFPAPPPEPRGSATGRSDPPSFATRIIDAQ